MTNGKEDAVSISKLGKALTGVAAEAFKFLDPKAKGKLEGLVNSGQISAEDVALGLRSIATQATFGRFSRERSKDADDLVREKQQQTLDNAFQARSKDSGALSKQVNDVMRAYENNEISAEEMNKEMAVARSKGAEIREKYSSVDGMNPSDLQSSIVSGGLSKNMTLFSSLDFENSEDGFLPLTDEKGGRAEEALISLGFDRAVYSDAFDRYAATVDIPGIGRGSYTPVSSEAPASTAKEPANEPAAQAPASAAPQATPAAAPAANADPSNSAAALSLLQSALNTGTKPGATGLFGNAAGNGASASGGMADSLLQSLKAGAGKPKADDAQGV